MIHKSFPPNKCRLCGLIKSQGFNVYSASAKRDGLLSKISKHLSKEVVHIAVGDGLPKFICTDCERVINNFTKFCNMVQDVQKRLEEEKLKFPQEVPVESNIDLNIVGTTFHKNKPTTSCSQDEPIATVSIGPDGKVECMLCHTYLEAVEHTTLHMVTHGIGTVICCCRTCGHQSELAQFIRTGNRGGKLTSTVWCNSCHFLSANKLKGDKNSTLSKNKTNMCEICSKSFRSHGHLVRHRLVHSGAKPFLCEICGTGFSQRSSLKLHVLSHAGLNPHKCSHCGQTFRFRVSLRSHVLSSHGSPSSMSSTEKTIDYKCDRCGKQFATVYKLRRHYRSHTGERPYECTRCGKLFSQTGNLNLHKKKHEEDDAVAGSFSTGANFGESIVTETHLSNVIIGKDAGEPYGVPLLTQQQQDPQHENPSTSNQYIPQAGQVLVSDHDPKFLETILQHPVVPCHGLGDPENPLSSIDTVLLNSTSKVPDHTSQFVSLNSEFSTASSHITTQDYLTNAPAAASGTKAIEHKNSTELFTHFSHEGLLFIDQSAELQETSNSEGVTLPTFSSLQSGSVSMSNLPH